jgi:hypothetical protein
MRTSIMIIVASIFALTGLSCASSPKPRPQPNYEQVRQDQQGAQQELQNEEDQKSDP